MDTILYFGGGLEEFALDRLPGARVAEDGAVHFRGSGSVTRRRRLVGMAELERTASYLRRQPVDALIVDARSADSLARTNELLERLFPHGRMGGPVSRRRILAVVAPGALAEAFSLGRWGIGGVLTSDGPEAFAERLDELLGERGHGKIALCLAGGGIEGLLYEVGVLRALESFLVDRSVVDFDFFCGISAGAILGSLLANGIGPDEVLRALEGRGHRLSPIGKWDLFEPNGSEIACRVYTLATELVRGGRGPRGILSSLARSVPSAAFSGRRLGGWLERQLGQPGMSDSFDGLRRPLYVGATDQDTAQAVLFGAGAHRHVPVSKAVHASCALVPFYPPVEVDGRWYVDGAFSRTTNMRQAATRGATLVVIVDPLVPVRSAKPGYVRARGGIYGTTQGLKALINGRFDKAVGAIAEMYPNVAFHLFRPEATEMRIMSGSPMKYFYRPEVEQIAYETTVQKIRAALPQLGREFARHGVTLQDPDDRPARPSAPPRIEAAALGI